MFIISSTKETVVIYKSKYGSSKRYAKWIAQDINCDLFSISQVKIDDLLEYETIIFGGGIYIGRINGIKMIKKNFAKLKDKNIIIFVIGVSKNMKETKADILTKNFTTEMKKKVDLFMFRGAFDREQLNLIDKFLMWGLKVKIKFKDQVELTEEEKGILKIYDRKVDWTEKETIKKLVKAVEQQK